MIVFGNIGLSQTYSRNYKKMFEIFNKNADVVKRVTFWGISDTRSWRRGQNPLLFDGELKPKAALEAVINVGLGKS